MSLLRRLAYQHVGRKHTEALQYTVEACQQFNLILTRPEQQSQAEKRKLGSKAVNRLFVSCLFSRIIGNNFPLSIYLSQTVKFHRDILLNEEVTGQIQVIKDLGKRKYEINTVCRASGGELLVEGIAIIMQE